MRIAFTLIVLLFCTPTLACRCQPLPLADYYAQADTVQIARLKSSQNAGGDRVLEFSLITPFKPLSRADDSMLAYRTGGSTASCGVLPQPGASYVLFARTSPDDKGLPRIDTCSGSRLLFSADGKPGSDFIDVPLRFVPQQLLGLAGLDTLKSIRWPQETDVGNTVLTGLLDLKTLAHGGTATLYAKPQSSAATLGMIRAWPDVEFRESSYEMPAAVVYAKKAGWYRLRLADGRYGWLAPDQAGSYFPFAKLVPRRLNYLTAAWNGLVWPAPGAGLPARHRATASATVRGEHPAHVLEARQIANSLWFRVEILDGDECSGDEPQPVLAGWIPAYGKASQPSAWFYARGC